MTELASQEMQAASQWVPTTPRDPCNHSLQHCEQIIIIMVTTIILRLVTVNITKCNN